MGDLPSIALILVVPKNTLKIVAERRDGNRKTPRSGYREEIEGVGERPSFSKTSFTSLTDSSRERTRTRGETRGADGFGPVKNKRYPLENWTEAVLRIPNKLDVTDAWHCRTTRRKITTITGPEGTRRVSTRRDATINSTNGVQRGSSNFEENTERMDVTRIESPLENPVGR